MNGLKADYPAAIADGSQADLSQYEVLFSWLQLVLANTRGRLYTSTLPGPHLSPKPVLWTPS